MLRFPLKKFIVFSIIIQKNSKVYGGNISWNKSWFREDSTEVRGMNLVDWKTMRFSWWLPLCSLADGISVSRPAGSRNDARSVEPGKLLYRYTRPKGECTAKCCLCTCTLASSVYVTCARGERTQIHKQLFYIEVIHSKSRCRWRRLLRSSPLSVFLSLRSPASVRLFRSFLDSLSQCTRLI